MRSAGVVRWPWLGAAWVMVTVLVLGLAGPARAVGDERAVVSDGAAPVHAGGSDFFFVETVDGKEVAETVRSLSRVSGAGRASFFVVRNASRTVPAGRVRLKLVGRRVFPVPIENLFRSSASWSVEGEVDVVLLADVRYRVSGRIDGFRRQVWLEREDTREVLAQLSASAMDDPAVQRDMAGAGYTCCNLHYEGDWISDGNWQHLPFVPAGARIVVKDYGRHRADVLIEGRPMRIGLDYGRTQQSREAFVEKLIVREDPALQLARFEPAVQAAIRAGKLRLGLTREQVLMSLGVPRMDTTPTLAERRWTYWYTEHDAYTVIWGSDGRVEAIEASEPVRAMVIHTD